LLDIRKRARWVKNELNIFRNNLYQSGLNYTASQ